MEGAQARAQLACALTIGVDPNVRDSSGQTALHLASRRRNVAVPVAD